MQMRLDHMRTLSLCLVCIVGLACCSTHAGKTCGGFAGIQCAGDEYCDFADNDCGLADGTGTCMRRPDFCPDIYRPACACDGKVYSTECDAAAQGFDVSASGNCESPAGYFSCGGHFCDLSAYCKHERDRSGAAAFSCVQLPPACSSAASCGCLSAEACGKSCTGDAQGGLTLTCP